MVKTAMKIGTEDIEVVNMAPLLLALDKLKKEINQDVGGDEKLKGELGLKIESIIKEKEVKTVGEKVSDLAQIISKSPEIANGNEIGVVAKKIELATEELVRRYPGEVEELKKEDFKKDFEEEGKNLNPNLDEEQLNNLKDYAELVAENSFGENILDDQKNEALEANKDFGPGKLENSWSDLKQVVNFLQKSPEDIKNVKEKYNSIKDKLKGVNLPSNLKEARSFEKIVSSLSNPYVDGLFSKTKNYLGWADRVDKLTGGWLNKTVAKAGQKFVNKIGNQAIQDFAKNGLEKIASEGFEKGFTNILKGVLEGGIKTTASTGGGAAVTGAAGTAVSGAAESAVASAVAAGGTSASGAVVGSAAAASGVTTAGVTGGMAIGGATAGAAAGGTAVGVAGGVATGGAAVGGTAVAAPAVGVIAIIVVVVVLGLFIYQLFQGSTVSSLVPPKGAVNYTDEESDENNSYTPGEPNYWNINVPRVPVNFTRQDLLNVAFSLRKKVTYFWAGEWNHYGNNPDWGIVKKYVYCGDSTDHFTCGTWVLDGLDCSGYILWLYYQLTGTAISGHYSGAMLAKAERREWQFIEPANLKAGDIAYRRGHVAIFIGLTPEGNKLFIHSYTSKWPIDITSDTTRYEGKPATAPFTHYLRPNIKFYDDE